MLHWWLAIRPKTLLAAVGPVLLATALAAGQIQIDQTIFVLTLSCAIFLQIGVNLANDLFDALSGVDSQQRLGPTRMVNSGNISASHMKKALGLTLLLATASGLPLVLQGGWPFLLLGLLSILAALAYSAGPFPLASNALGEITVFIFFGLIAVMGSYYLQTHRFDWFIVPFAMVCGLFSAAMMLVNNIRDRETDQQANKHTIAVLLGNKNSQGLYIGLLTIVCLLQLWTLLEQSTLLLVPLLISGILSFQLVKRLRSCTGKAYNKLLEQTARVGFIYALVAAVCLWVG